MKFREYLDKPANPYIKMKVDKRGNKHYLMDIRRDRFIHFTLVPRLNEIIQTKKLLMDPPYKKFGIDAISAISLLYGKSVPGVQTTHHNVKNEDELGAIMFSTKTIPKYGVIEETVWETDVNIIMFKLLTTKQAKNKLTQNIMKLDDQDMVHYSKESYDKII